MIVVCMRMSSFDLVSSLCLILRLPPAGREDRRSPFHYLWRVDVSRGTPSVGNSGARKHRALETLLCPRPGPVNASGLCPQTRLVSRELGGGAATGRLVTDHQEGERERRSNQPRGLQAFCPDAPGQSALYI